MSTDLVNGSLAGRFCGPPMQACIHMEYYLQRQFATCLNRLARYLTDKSSILLECNAWIPSGNRLHLFVFTFNEFNYTIMEAQWVIGPIRSAL